MKKILFLLLVVNVFAFQSKFTPDINVSEIKCSQVLHNTRYDVCYDYTRKDPFYSAYYITKSDLKGKKYKRPTYFKSDYRIPKKYRSYNSDYAHQGYDKGHNCPNGVFNRNKKLQKETFIISNIAPQAKWLNRGLWKKIEIFTRVEALKYGKVEVITGNCGVKGYIKNKVAIPKYFFKIIYIPSEKRYISFLAPNTSAGMKTAEMKRYLSTYQEIKGLCHF